MDLARHLQQIVHSDEEQTRRRKRRASRLRHLSRLKEILDERQETSDFSQRHAYVWGFGEDSGPVKKLSGHPSVDASLYVAEALGEFDIEGEVKPRYAGMNRDAGYGAFGIIEGEINVDVAIIPSRGFPQYIEVPVQVKKGYMIQPGLFYYHGSPYIMSQSAFDAIMKEALYSEGMDVVEDRPNMYSPPTHVNESHLSSQRMASRSLVARHPETFSGVDEVIDYFRTEIERDQFAKIAVLDHIEDIEALVKTMTDPSLEDVRRLYAGWTVGELEALTDKLSDLIGDIFPPEKQKHSVPSEPRGKTFTPTKPDRPSR